MHFRSGSGVENRVHATMSEAANMIGSAGATNQYAASHSKPVYDFASNWFAARIPKASGLHE